MKRVISALLSVSVIAAMAVGLTGCGDGGNANKIKFVALGEKPAANDAVVAKMNEIIVPELGLELEIEYIDSAAYNEKTKMKMASKEKFDIIYTGYVGDYQAAVEMGGLYDITDIMDNITMADGTTAKMSDVVDDYMIESAMVNGRIYGIPNNQVISNPSCISMEKRVADECGVDLEGIQKLALANKNTETSKALIDKITAELAKIKATRPDLYSVAPFNAAQSNIYEELIGGVGIRKDGSSNEVYIGAFTEEHQYGIDAIHEWYKAGYIRNDVVTNNSTGTAAEAALYGITTTTWKPGQEAYFLKDRGTEPAYAFLAEPFVGRKNALLTMLSVGANTTHPEEAVKLIYMLNSNKELYNLLCWGIEGVHHTKNEDGTVSEIKGSGYEGIGQNAWRYGNQFNGYILQGQEATVWEETDKMNDDALKSPALGFVPNQEPIATEIANVNNVNAEYKAKISYGTSPRSEYWDAYVADMKSAGIEKIQAEIQKQYDAWLATK